MGGRWTPGQRLDTLAADPILVAKYSLAKPRLASEEERKRIDVSSILFCYPARRFAAIITLSLGAVQLAHGHQQVGLVNGAVACQSCRIDLTRVAVLGDTTGGAGELSAPFHRLDTDSRGRFFVTTEAALIAMFSPTGSFLGRVGADGEGPGEYRFPRALAIDHDTLFVGDITTARLTIVDLRDTSRRPPRSVVVPEFAFGALQALRLPSGAFLTNMVLLRAEDIGYPLHTFSSEGKKLRSFGVEVPAYRPDRPLALMRRLAASRSGGAWAAWFLAPRLEEYDSAGVLRGGIELALPWFPARDGSERPASPEGEAPGPRIAALYEDPAGLLWIAVSVADRRWRQAFRRVPSPKAPGYRWRVDDYNKLYDTILLVVDPATRRVLTQRRIEDEIAWLDRRTGWAAVVRVNPTGLSRVEVLRPKLVQ